MLKEVGFYSFCISKKEIICICVPANTLPFETIFDLAKPSIVYGPRPNATNARNDNNPFGNIYRMDDPKKAFQSVGEIAHLINSHQRLALSFVDDISSPYSLFFGYRKNFENLEKFHPVDDEIGAKILPLAKRVSLFLDSEPTVIHTISDYIAYLMNNHQIVERACSTIFKSILEVSEKRVADYLERKLAEEKLRIEILKQIETILEETNSLFESHSEGSSNQSQLREIGVLGCKKLCELCDKYSIPVPETLYNFEREFLCFYRGVTSPYYPEIPSVLRENSHFQSVECDYYREFKLRNSNRFANRSLVETLTDMQHYELPTRLLDITSNPLVALFMACDSRFSSQGDTEDFGEVISYFPRRDKAIDELKYFDSIRTQVLAALPMLSHYEKSEMKRGIRFLEGLSDPQSKKKWTDFFKGLGDLPSDDIYDSPETTRCAFACLERVVKGYIPAFNLEKYNLCDLLRAHYLRAGLINERISAQSGAFIIFGLDENYVDDNFISSRRNEDSFQINRCIIADKARLLRELKVLGIGADVMYPSLPNTAKEICEPPFPNSQKS